MLDLRSYLKKQKNIVNICRRVLQFALLDQTQTEQVPKLFGKCDGNVGS